MIKYLYVLSIPFFALLIIFLSVLACLCLPLVFLFVLYSDFKRKGTRSVNNRQRRIINSNFQTKED